ncbi:MAG: ABC transporter permease, partial [Anaerolineales bacterium]|nr:ABC transporter permease [Anaerolineales bacterium]
MTGYLIRRLFQMVIVVFVSAVATYALLNFAPGGPLSGLRQMTQSTKFRITEEDIARIRAYYELDLKLPVRFSRWLIGHPRGRIVIGGTELFANTPVGCRKSIEAVVRLSNGDEETRTIGCSEYVYLRDLENRRSSKGILMGDFGLSWRLLRDRPVSDLILSRLPKTLQLMGISILISFLFGVPLGIYSAIKQYSRFDYFVTTLAFFGSSMPTFFFGLLLILLFSILPKGAGLPYLPPGSSE